MRRGSIGAHWLAAALSLALVLAIAPAGRGLPKRLRVCADPNNLPFSNARGEGFENRIAALLARDLGVSLEYTWHAQRRGFLRNTLDAGRCDLVMGVPASLDRLETTRPYYRSSYVFVQRAGDRHRFISLDDPALRTQRIAVQLIGDDSANSPPAHALARRGIVDNVVGFMVYGDYSSADPGAPIVTAVVDGTVDLALVWGPLAGYYAARADVKLHVMPVSPADDGGLPLTFAISLGVRQGDTELKARLEAALERQRPSISRILRRYSVPVLAE